MSNYYSVVRTNYFRVTDEEELRKVIGKIQNQNSEIELWELQTRDGGKAFAFGGDGSIDYYDEGDDDVEPYDVDMVYNKLQEILNPDDAIIITEVGREALRYLTAYSIVITKNDIQNIDLEQESADVARALLHNKNYSPRCSY